jgi:hypothetical protein
LFTQIENARTLQQYEYNKSEKDKQELQKKIEEINNHDQYVLNSSTKTINEKERSKLQNVLR